jgi:hypothetical protein
MSSTVLPSGSARATSSVPTSVPPPGRFSTSTVKFCARLISFAISRDKMSGPLPGV